MTDVTRILSEIEQGDPAAAEKLLPLVYQELRKLARPRALEYNAFAVKRRSHAATFLTPKAFYKWRRRHVIATPTAK